MTSVAPMPDASAPDPLSPERVSRLRALDTRWSNAAPAERANFQSYLIDLCDAIGVPRPGPAARGGGAVREGLAYQFEFPVQTTTRADTIATNFVDLYKAGCFALEARDSGRDATPA